MSAWTPTKIVRPEPGRDVLGYWQGYLTASVVHLVGGKWYDAVTEDIRDAPTHWMYLPEFPEPAVRMV